MKHFSTQQRQPTTGAVGPVRPAVDPRDIRARRTAIALSAGLLGLFATLAWTAAAGKSPTFDEPYHALAGWMELWHGDYRFIRDHPPLWSMIAATATRPDSIHVDRQPLNDFDLPPDQWTVQTLFRTPGNDGVALIARCRAVMLAVGVAMGVLLACFAWRLARAGGADSDAAGAAAVVTTGLFALDPNFLAHAPLVKNDVASAFAFLGLVAVTWAAGRKLTPFRMLALGLWSGTAMLVKFNGPLLIACSAVLLALRALLPWPWKVQVRRGAVALLISRPHRLLTAAVTLLVMVVVTFCMIWFFYGARYLPAPQNDSSIDFRKVISRCMEKLWEAQHQTLQGVHPTSWALAGMRMPLFLRFAASANEFHIFPQAFLAGLVQMFQGTFVRPSFLCGRISTSGFWWYFPFAMAVKTPTATIAAVILAVLLAIASVLPRNRKSIAANKATPVWTALCLYVPVLTYFSASIWSGMNLGIRHLLPIYALLFAGVGWQAARYWKRRRGAVLAVGLTLLATLALESCAAYPNYIPFFNAPAGGSRGGLALLSDSNLDWGQDLPLLASWQRKNPNVKLYLAYFGLTDPSFYGIRYTNLRGGYVAGPPPQHFTDAGVIAISATTLQGMYCNQAWSPLWAFKPFDVLGGSIYLFHYPPTKADRQPKGKRLIE